MVDTLYLITVLGVILISMTAHEAMHAFMGYVLGDDTAKAQGRLTLNPIKHIDPFMTLLLPIGLALMGLPIFGGAKPVPFNSNRVEYGEWGVALVALVGPLTNFLLAFTVFGFGVVTGVIADGGIAQNSAVGTIISTTVSINLGFFVFNMIPLPPLDGSRILYALAPESARRVMELIEQYGVFVVFIIILIFSSAIGQVMLVCMNFILKLFMLIFGV